MLTEPLSALTARTLQACGVTTSLDVAGGMEVVSPLTGETVASVAPQSAADAEAAVSRAAVAFRHWRMVPGPRRGELVRLFAEELRASKDDLGRMVSIEAGKSPSEGAGEGVTGRSRQVTSLDSPGEQATDDVLLEEQSKDNWGNHSKDPGSDDGDIADIERRGEHPSDHGAGVGLLSLSDQESEEEFPPGEQEGEDGCCR